MERTRPRRTQLLFSATSFNSNGLVIFHKYSSIWLPSAEPIPGSVIDNSRFFVSIERSYSSIKWRDWPKPRETSFRRICQATMIRKGILLNIRTVFTLWRICVDKPTRCNTSYEWSLSFIIWLYMFRTITSPSSGASSHKLYNALLTLIALIVAPCIFYYF